MGWTLFDIVLYTFSMLISFAFFSRGFGKRLKSNILIMLIGIALYIPSSFVFSFLNNEIINLSLFFIINFIFAISCFQISVKDSIIFSILLDTIMFSTELLTIFAYSSIFKAPTGLYKENLTMFIIMASISKILYLAVSQLLLLIIKRNNYGKSNSKQFLPLFIFPVLTIASSFIFIMIAIKTEMSIQYQIAISIISVLSIFACIFIFIYYQLLSDNEVKVNELEREKQFYNLNNTYLDVLQHQNDELQMLFHDMKHHYLALSSFDNISDVRDYIEKLYPDLEQKNNIKISSNKMLDLILNKYIVICKTKGIKFSYEVKTADLSYIDDSELSIILNNILDNAVEAATNSKEKVIDFSLRHINSMDMLSVINSCDSPPVHQHRRLITTKDNSQSHGFGTKIIEKHTKMNNGQYEWFYDDSEKQFHLNIIFQKNK